MAGTIATDLAFFSAAINSSCDVATTSWAGYTFTIDTEAMIEGTGCSSFKLNVTTTVSAAVVFTPTAAVDMSSKYMYFWTQGLRLAQWQTKTEGGIRAYFADATNWAEWFVNGKDTMQGGWAPHAARPVDIVDAAIRYYGPSTYTDQTAEANNNTANDMTLMRTAGEGTPATGDAYFIGKTMPYKRVIFRVGTAGVGTYTITYKYWNGTAWTALSGVTDRTTNWTVAGVNRVEYTLPTDWVPYTVNGQGPFYYIKAELTVYTSMTTRPLGTRGWIRFGKDPERSDIVANTGDTNANKEVDWGQVTKVGWRCKLLLGATKNNCFFDAFRYGSYLQNTGGGIGTEGSFADFITDATNGEDAKSWGVVQKIDGVYSVQGNLYIGSSGTASTNFKDTDAHIRIKNNDSVGDNVMGIDFFSNSTGASVIQFGNLTVSGGKNLTSGGLLIDTDGPKYIFNVTQTQSTDTAYVYATKFKGCSRFRIGTTATTAGYWKLIGNKFEACNTIRVNDGGNSVFDQNSIASALTVPSLNAIELYALASSTVWTDNAFINNITADQRAIVFMASGTYSMTRNTFGNNTFDLYFSHPSGTVTTDLVDSTDNPTLGPTASNSLSYDVYERTTYNLNLKNTGASPIVGAGVRLADQYGTQQFADVTGGGGSIAQQQMKRRTSEHSSGLPKGAPTVTVHNPYNLRFRRYDYLPREIGGKVFGAVAISDAFVMEDDIYAVTDEGTVAAWANITLNEATTPDRIELGPAAPNHSINDVYERMRYLTALVANLDLPDPIETADGTTYMVDDYDFQVDTVVLTGTGKTLYMPTRDFTLVNGGSHSLQRVQDIDGALVALVVTCKDAVGLPVSYVRVRIEKRSDNSLISNGYAGVDGVYTDGSYTYTADVDVNVISRLKGWTPFSGEATIGYNGLDVPVVMPVDEAVDMP